MDYLDYFSKMVAIGAAFGVRMIKPIVGKSK